MENNPEYQPLSKSKTIAVCAIVVGCFAVLYPKFFHPMVGKIMGSEPAQTEQKDQAFVPPQMRAIPAGASSPRTGAHPGMRAAAAEMKAQQQQSGPGRGMMGIVLPMYAVGIFVYLIYTLVKVFSKKDENKSTTRGAGKLSHLKHKYSYKDGKFEYRDDISDTDAYREYMRRKHAEKHQPDTREEREMEELQKRLLETETQMARILDAMKNISGRVEQAAGDIEEMGGDSGGLDDLEEKSREQEQNSTSDSKLLDQSNLEPSNTLDDLHAETLGAMETDKMAAGDESESESETGLNCDSLGENVDYMGSDDSESGSNNDIIEDLKDCQSKMLFIEEKMLEEEESLRQRQGFLTDGF